MLQWGYPGLSTNDGGDVQQRSGLFLARRGGLFFGRCIVLYLQSPLRSCSFITTLSRVEKVKKARQSVATRFTRENSA